MILEVHAFRQILSKKTKQKVFPSHVSKECETYIRMEETLLSDQNRSEGAAVIEIRMDRNEQDILSRNRSKQAYIC